MNIIKYVVNYLMSKIRNPIYNKRTKNKIVIKVRDINIFFYFFDD